MDLNEEERAAALRSIEAVRRLGSHLERIPMEFFYADRSRTLLYSQALAQKTGWQDWVNASREEGFWNAMESAAQCVIRRMTGLRLGDNSDISIEDSILWHLASNPSPSRLAELCRGALPLIQENPAFFDEMVAVRSGKKLPKGQLQFRASFGPKDSPTWEAVRGWTSHHYWLMGSSALKQMIPGLTDDMAKHLFRTHGIVSHPKPPILGITEDDRFQFRVDWRGVRPRPSAIQAVPAIIQVQKS